MVVIERTKTLRQGLSLGLRSGFSRIPVIGENADDIVGVIYLKDLVRRVFDHRDAEDGERVESLMRPVFFVPDSKAVDELLKDMQAARVHLAIAVDEYGGTAGLVTIEDILEEIVGEIADEYDTEMPEVTELEAGSYRISSRMHVDDVAELLNIEIDADEEGIDTVLGLMAKRLGRVAISGSSITEEGYTFTAEASGGRRNRISAIRVEPVAKPEESEDA
jgi:CBS domain containing-hemolysin-like protein